MSDAERRLKELEEQVRAEQAARRMREEQSLAKVRETPMIVPPGTRPARTEPPPKRGGLLSTWKGKLLVVGGAVVAGAVTLWVLEKVFKVALYVGVAGAVVLAGWWLFFRKKK